MDLYVKIHALSDYAIKTNKKKFDPGRDVCCSPGTSLKYKYKLEQNTRLKVKVKSPCASIETWYLYFLLEKLQKVSGPPQRMDLSVF